ncbi:MAG TPA: glutaredoxin family protein [Deltaproteobacteria bacterium]|nr:glutaredoxin family protein [Deltaproteobacteria bacterium]
MKDKTRLYTLSTCGHCKDAKKFLNDFHVDFEFTEVDQLRGQEREDIIKDIRALNSKLTFPTIVIGEHVIVGFREDELREALGI